MMPDDMFPLFTCFGDGKSVFENDRKSISEIKNSCAIFIDANVLLAPYNLSDKSIDQIKRTYQSISEENRLYIPSQVAAEYAKNRAAKIGDILKTVNDQISKLQSPLNRKYSILRIIDSYRGAVELSDHIEIKNKELGVLLKKVSEEIRSWETLDPVLEIYKSVLSGRVVDLSNEGKQAIQEELKYRHKHSIPPGFKDDNKSDGGAGDLIIWKTILEICRDQKRDAIFVTLDQKSDWWSQAAGGTLFARSELAHEFSIYTSGRTMHLQLFSEFLNSFGADKTTIDQVKYVEDEKTDKDENEDQMHAIDYYDMPKVAIRYLGLQEEYEKLGRDIKGRWHAYKRCIQREDYDKAKFHQEMIREMRELRHKIRKDMLRISEKYPQMMKDDSLNFDLLRDTL